MPHKCSAPYLSSRRTARWTPQHQRSAEVAAALDCACCRPWSFLPFLTLCVTPYRKTCCAANGISKTAVFLLRQKQMSTPYRLDPGQACRSAVVSCYMLSPGRGSCFGCQSLWGPCSFHRSPSLLPTPAVSKTRWAILVARGPLEMCCWVPIPALSPFPILNPSPAEISPTPLKRGALAPSSPLALTPAPR